ncbi:hypothetical protein AM355_29710 (plasmid) [Klebsiella oxytoca]|nr:hypothetical protein AM355_29710 [Klebsiella oxytoca]
MSVTESKTKTPAKTSKKAVKPAESAALKAALEAAHIEMVPLSALVKSPLNVRTIPYPPESVREMADSILAVGLIQNLVVHTLPDGLSGVAAGGRRLAALQLLQREQRIDAGHLVIVKRVSDELAVVASMVENNNRVAMHPAEQITGFRALSEQGKTPAQIGDQLGYSSRHVQRMLKLASLAPELIALLAENKLDVEQCQALSLESDPARQVEIYQRVKAQHSYAPAHMLKRAITDTEISVRDARFMFVGREAYEAAGGNVREDLFSAQEGDGTADGVLVGRLVQEKLESAALAVEMQEGWSWSLAREGAVRNYGDDREHYLVLPEPEAILFANPIAQGACAADAMASAFHMPLDILFWCAGSQGSMYPFSGWVSNESSPLQSSLLVSERMAYKLHRQGQIMESIGKDKAVCYEYPSPIIPKERWRYQMVNMYPDSGQCHPVGRSVMRWEAGKNPPNTRKNYGYLMWRKRNCVFL